MSEHVFPYHKSPALFHTMTERRWHRKFTAHGQVKLLSEMDASIVVHEVAQTVPFSGEPVVMEYPVMQLVLKAKEHDTFETALAIVEEFRPDFIKYEAVGYDDAFPTCVLSWKKGFAADDQRVTIEDISVEKTTNCHVSRDDMIYCSELKRQIGVGPFYLYGSLAEGWLFADEQLSEKHQNIILKGGR